MPDPEELARQEIDALLKPCGWDVQDKSAVNLTATRGVAVRELTFKTGEPDYTLFADGKAIGTVEAKPEGHSLIGGEEQSEKYVKGVPLEQFGYLRRENDKYWVSLTALAQIEHEAAKRLVDRAEQLFEVLKSYYKENQKDFVVLSELAHRAAMDLEAVKECLSYMIEGSWWGGHSNDFFSTDNPQVKPSEAILKYRSFNDVLNQLREWQAQRVQDRKYLTFRRRPPVTSTGRGPVQRAKPVWYVNLPEDVQNLLDEVYLGVGMNMRALPSMGLRTIIDMVCNDLVGDIGGFGEKLDALEKRGYVNAREHGLLKIAVDVGNASAHRGHNPNMEDLNTLLDIVEYLLQGIYVLSPASERLKDNTPRRKPDS